MRSTFAKSVLIAAVTVLFLAGPALAGIPKNVLVIVHNHENIKTLDPGVCFESPTGVITKNVYAGLVFVSNEDGKFVVEPELADKWQVAEDGKTWTFHLRDKVKFSDGTPITSADVVYSLQRVIKLAASPAWLLTDVLGLTEESVTALDDRTVQIVTNGASENVVLTNLGDLVGAVLNAKVVKSHYKDDDMGKDWLTSHSAGAGAYTIKEWKRNEALIFEANANYWRGKAALKTILIKDVPEAADQYLLIKKGDADVALELTDEQAKGLAQEKGDVVIHTTPGQSNEYVGMNVGFEPFKDNRVRQAVKYAIDYRAIMDKAVAGYAINNQQFISKGYFGYAENNPFKLDLEKAKKLMAEAGYPNGFEVELVTNTKDKRRNAAIIVQENLAKIGIKANLNIMQAAQMYAKFRKQGINMIVAGWGNDYPDADDLATPFVNYRVKQLAWRLAWEDDKAADMAEAAAREKDPQKRLADYKELTGYFHANGPYAMLYQPLEHKAARRTVKGFDKAFAGYPIHFSFYKLSK